MPQSYSSILIHLVFSTKHRMPIITPEAEVELYKYCNKVLNTNDSPALAIGGTADHIHILFALARTKSVADVVEELKADSSKWFKKKGRKLKNFYWQAGYGAFSIGRSGVPDLIAYIERQKEHHKKVPFQREFTSPLKLYDVEYDERYIWD